MCTGTEQTAGKVKRIPCLVMSRVVGYISPLHLWNDGKQQEFKDRKTYKIPKTDS